MPETPQEPPDVDPPEPKEVEPDELERLGQRARGKGEGERGTGKKNRERGKKEGEISRKWAWGVKEGWGTETGNRGTGTIRREARR